MTMSWKQHQNACKALNFIWIFNIIYEWFSHNLIFSWCCFFSVFASYYIHFEDLWPIKMALCQMSINLYEMFTSFNRKIIAMRCYTIGKEKKNKLKANYTDEEKWNQTKYQKNSVMQNLHLNRNVCAMHNTKRRNMCGFVISKNASIYQNNQTEMSLIPCTCWASSHFVIGSLAFASLVL